MKSNLLNMGITNRSVSMSGTRRKCLVTSYEQDKKE